MARLKVKDPTGKVWNLSATVATGLVGGTNSKWEFVGDEPDTATGTDDGTQPPFPDGAPIFKWTVPQLVAWAEAHGVDLGEAKKKDDVWAIVEAAASSTKTPASGTAPAGDAKDNPGDAGD